MSSPQEYWDACLIKTWRRAGTIMDAASMFYSITHTVLYEIEPRLLRTPAKYVPWKMGVRVFVSRHLSKISKRMFEQPPERDVALLHKLKDSKYDTEEDTIPDAELRNEQRKIKKNASRNEYMTRKMSERNQHTDGNVNKGPR